MSDQANLAFNYISTASGLQCYKACVVHPDTQLSNSEKNCILRCTERYFEAIQVCMAASETYKDTSGL